MSRALNAYLNVVVGGSAAGFIYGSFKGLTIVDRSANSPEYDLLQKRYGNAVINSMMGASIGFIAGGFFGMASPVLVPTFAYSLWKARKN